MPDQPERDEIEALLAARRELGAEYDASLVESFAGRVEEAIAAQVAARVEADRRVDRAGERDRERAQKRHWVLGIVSCGVAVPITGITAAGAEGSPEKMLVAWGGLVGINLAHALATVLTRRRA